MSQTFKAGYVGLIGLPNAGKSTLMNHLVGEKVAIVSALPQTTRNRVVGILSDEEKQIVFVDAPGIVKAEKGLNHFLQKEYESVIEESDVLLLVLNIDCGQREKLEELIAWAMEWEKPWWPVVTKCDLPEKRRILTLQGMLEPTGKKPIEVSKDYPRQDIDKALTETLWPMLPDSEGPLFDPDWFTTQNSRQLATEIVREKCFEYLRQEVPYKLATRMVRYEEKPGIHRIHIDIVVSQESYKPIVVGEKGRRIKKIGSEARKELESLLETKIHLELHVVVRDKWYNSYEIMKDLGYVVESN